MYPEFLYKAVPPEFVQPLLRSGRVRIGTLHEYRTHEASAICDPKDGIRDLEIDSFYADNISTAQLPYAVSLVVGGGGIGSYDFRRCNVVEDLPNCHIYCTSLTLDGAKRIHRTGVRIRRPLEFGKIIERYLAAEGLIVPNSLWASRCTYVPKKQLYTKLVRVAPLFQKDVKYTDDREFRLAWQPKRDTLVRFRIIDMPEVTSLLEPW